MPDAFKRVLRIVFDVFAETENLSSVWCCCLFELRSPQYDYDLLLIQPYFLPQPIKYIRPLGMAPQVSYAKTTLSYPIYAAEFDPYNRGYLVTAGGGGESKSGIGNKITVLDVAAPHAITTAAEIELSKNEDNPTCVANLASKDGLITFAGINNGTAELNTGKNQHFRSFSIQYPPRRKAPSTEKDAEPTKGNIIPIGKAQLFSPEKDGKQECYQRIVRLSPARRKAQGEGANRRLGAITTGGAQKSEVLIFDATTSTPGGRDVIRRIEPPKNDEAKDVDWADLDDAQFRFAYCTEGDVYVQKLKYDFDGRALKGEAKEAEKIWSIPNPAPGEGPGKRKLRALRFLTPNHLLLLVNLPAFKGAEMLILRLYDDGAGEVVLRKRLASHVKAATGLDVCALDADPKTGARQIVIAVAGQDISVSILTLDHSGTRSDTLSKFRTISVTRDVHAFQITQIRLSPFHPPSVQSSSANSVPKETSGALVAKDRSSKQRIHLATTSMGNTVVVDTITLQSFSDRYILSSARAAQLQTGATITMAGFVGLVILLLLQSFIAATYPDSAIAGLNLQQYVPQEFRDTLSRMAPPGSYRRAVVEEVEHVYEMVEGVISHPFDGETRLGDLLNHLIESGHLSDHASPDSQHPEKGAIIIRPSPDSPDSGNADTVALSTDLHPEGAKSVLKADKHAKRWDELDDKQKALWRKRLSDAGAWIESEGETVLKGIFFSSYAGVVGDIAAQALR